jgi:hypothetical protein
MSLSQFRICPRVMKTPRMAVCDISRCYMPLRCEPKGAALDQYLKGARVWSTLESWSRTDYGMPGPPVIVIPGMEVGLLEVPFPSAHPEYPHSKTLILHRSKTPLGSCWMNLGYVHTLD